MHEILTVTSVLHCPRVQVVPQDSLPPLPSGGHWHQPFVIPTWPWGVLGGRSKKFLFLSETCPSTSCSYTLGSALLTQSPKRPTCASLALMRPSSQTPLPGLASSPAVVFMTIPGFLATPCAWVSQPPDVPSYVPCSFKCYFPWLCFRSVSPILVPGIHAMNFCFTWCCLCVPPLGPCARALREPVSSMNFSLSLPIWTVVLAQRLS